MKFVSTLRAPLLLITMGVCLLVMAGCAIDPDKSNKSILGELEEADRIKNRADKVHSADLKDLTNENRAEFEQLRQEEKNLLARKQAKAQTYDQLGNKELQAKNERDSYEAGTKGREELQNKRQQYQNEKEQISKEIAKLETEINEKQRKMDQILNETQKSCFPKGTQVLLADGSYKKIDRIEIGDEVMTYDIAGDVIDSAPANKAFTSPNNHYYLLNGAIKATAYERFLTQNGWKKIRDLEVGDSIFNGNSYELVQSVKKVVQELKVYNLNIATSHNFFISNDSQSPVLVHNTDGGGGGK